MWATIGDAIGRAMWAAVGLAALLIIIGTAA